jgi:hypothetical protein
MTYILSHVKIDWTRVVLEKNKVKTELRTCKVTVILSDITGSRGG